MKVLDLFCGAGGASMGLHQAGFEVTGVDINPQPNYPFKFIQADALTVSLEGYDLIWASPPCQAFTNAQKIMKREHPDLVDPIRQKLIASGIPYIIENVPGSPLINPITLCGAMFNLRTYRHRLFEASFPISAPEHPLHLNRTAKMGRQPKLDEFMHIVGNFSNVKLGREAMGIPWMSRNELSESIPPAYSKYLAEQFISQLR
jgi:DNA (cytosine-5)-methyltransferase 1